MSTCHILNYSSCSPRNLEISTILDIKIAADPNTVIGHTYSKEVQLEGGRYNRADRGYFHTRLPNGKIFLKSILWYFCDCYIWFGRRT